MLIKVTTTVNFTSAVFDKNTLQAAFIILRCVSFSVCSSTRANRILNADTLSSTVLREMYSLATSADTSERQKFNEKIGGLTRNQQDQYLDYYNEQDRVGDARAKVESALTVTEPVSDIETSSTKTMPVAEVQTEVKDDTPLVEANPQEHKDTREEKYPASKNATPIGRSWMLCFISASWYIVRF